MDFDCSVPQVLPRSTRVIDITQHLDGNHVVVAAVNTPIVVRLEIRGLIVREKRARDKKPILYGYRHMYPY